MTQEEDLVQVRAERKAWREIAYEKHQEVLQLRQDKQTVQEALKEAMQAIEGLRLHTKNLEEQVEVLRERVKTLERQAAKDSYNSSLPPSSDRFVRGPKSLRKKSGRKPGGQPGHAGHALHQIQSPDEIVVRFRRSSAQLAGICPKLRSPQKSPPRPNMGAEFRPSRPTWSPVNAFPMLVPANCSRISLGSISLPQASLALLMAVINAWLSGKQH